MPTLINTGRSGVTYDDAGHSLGGGERIDVDRVDDVAQAAIDRGQLRVAEDTGKPAPRDRDAQSGASRAE